MDYPKSVPNVGLVEGKFVDENPTTGQVGSLIPSAWGNSVTEELLSVIKAAGLTPDESQVNQLLKAIQTFAAADMKKTVRVATTGAISLSGLQSIDGVALAAGDRVLVKNQANAAQNGLYSAGGGVWVRTQDADENIEVSPGMMVPVQAGLKNHGSIWQLSNQAPPAVGVNELSFEQVVGSTGIESGVYQRVKVDRLGRVIDGDNPTTLDEFGITDAVKTSGGTLTGRLNMANASSVYIQTEDIGAWAAGLIAGKYTAETAGLGFAGNNGNVAVAFIGLGNTPWESGNGIRVSSSGIEFAGRMSGDASGLKKLQWSALERTPTELQNYGISFASKDEAEAGTDSRKPMSALNVAQAISKRIVQATESVLGIAKIASQDATNKGEDDTNFITPKKLFAGVLKAIGFTPVRQGGGVGHATNNTLYLGFSPDLQRPSITVDNTDFGGVAFASDLKAQPFSKEYVSAPQAFSNGGLVAVAHGLGTLPKIIAGELVCVGAENGWQVGDVQNISLSPDNDDSGVVVGFAARKDSANIYARCGVSGPYGVNINTGTTTGSINSSNWRLVLRAFA